MGTQERRRRDFAAREDRLLDAACALIREEGLLSLQMGRIAERCEYAVGTLYHHFVSKEDLLLAIVIRDFEDYASLLRRVAQWQAPSRERMFAVAVADIEFLRRQPDYFRLAQYVLSDVVWQATSVERRQAFRDANAPVAASIERIIIDASASGDLASMPQRPEELSLGLWAICAGFHSVTHPDGLLTNVSSDEVCLMLGRQVQALLDGNGWRPLAGRMADDALRALIERVRCTVFGCAPHVRTVSSLSARRAAPPQPISSAQRRTA